MLSNGGVAYGTYDDAGFAVEREGATRRINSDGTARGEADGTLATSVPEDGRPDRRGQASTGDFRLPFPASLPSHPAR